MPAGVRDLASGNPDPRLLPDLARVLPGVLAAPPRLYGEPPVDPELERVARAALHEDGYDARQPLVIDPVRHPAGYLAEAERRGTPSPRQERCGRSPRDRSRRSHAHPLPVPLRG